jgi:hypothetical protein
MISRSKNTREMERVRFDFPHGQSATEVLAALKRPDPQYRDRVAQASLCYWRFSNRARSVLQSVNG